MVEFNGRNYLQIHETAMGTKMAVFFVNILMSAVETEIIKDTSMTYFHCGAGVRKGLIRGEAPRLLRTNSSAKSFSENINKVKFNEVNERKSSLQQKENVPPGVA